ncbi:hypothetical protein Cgig2_033554 [Carnegiea gigantea]|uniref:Uncharacterized protein n=1 Tax=Carnegiea gigantea TaxID=171969 RepID=A0A9Q1JU03_9CARY|nr:hypothetical protein Cgig2_033554 [Carnegiea gigantea]
MVMLFRPRNGKPISLYRMLSCGRSQSWSKGPWRLRTHRGHSRTLIMHPLQVARLPTGIRVHHPPIILRRVRRSPNRTGMGNSLARGAGINFQTLRGNFRSVATGNPMLRGLLPMTAPPKPYNARKYYEFYEQSGYTIVEYRELKNALHKLADKGQIDHFLKKGPRLLHRE